jgi:hypothetical protein
MLSRAQHGEASDSQSDGPPRTTVEPGPRDRFPSSCRFRMTSVRSAHGPAVSAVAVGASLLDLVDLLLRSEPASGAPRVIGLPESSRRLKLLAQREAEAAARPIPRVDARRRPARARGMTVSRLRSRAFKHSSAGDRYLLVGYDFHICPGI